MTGLERDRLPLDTIGVPDSSMERLAALGFSALDVIGEARQLRSPLLGIFSSVRSPGDAVLRSYDLARALRDASVPTIGGFHSPMEKECLDLLLRGTQPVAVCPARSLTGLRIPSAWRPAIDDGRLLLVSPFDDRHRRITAELANRRNALVAAISTAILVLHAAPRSKIEHLALSALSTGTKVYVAVPEQVAALIQAGAIPLLPAEAHLALGCVP